MSTALQTGAVDSLLISMLRAVAGGTSLYGAVNWVASILQTLEV